MSPKHIAVIGGGRWAREIAQTLLKIKDINIKTTLCSPSQPESWKHWLAEGEYPPGFIVASSLKEIWLDQSIEATIVARRARDNGPTALASLKRGKSVLVEKPFSLDTLTTEALQKATTLECICMTGLVFYYAQNISEFYQALPQNQMPHRIQMEWCDPTKEQRRGVQKSFDSTINIIQDVFPHIWSLAKKFRPDAAIQVVKARFSENKDQAWLNLTIGGTPFDVKLARNWEKRVRKIEIEYPEKAYLDFSSEPGHAFYGDRELVVGSNFSSPLECQVRSFMSQLEVVDRGNRTHIQYAHEIIPLVDQMLVPYST